MSALKKLRPKQRLFCEQWVGPCKFNGTEAYKEAGYKVKSDDVANAAAARLLADVSIQEAIAELQAKRVEQVEITAEWIAKGLQREAEGEGPDTRASARVRAMEILAKMFGFLKDNPSVHVNIPACKHYGGFDPARV